MADYKFSNEHAWVLVDGDTAKIGITPYAAEQLGDVVYVDLPEVGEVLTAGDTFTEVESSKTSSEVPAPISGEILAVNDELDDSPELVNEDAFAAWIIEVKVEDDAELDLLLNEGDYSAICD